MKLFDLYGEVLLKDDNTKGKLQDINKEAEKSSSGFDKLKSGLLKFTAGAVSIAGVVKGFKDVTSAAMESENADNRLNTLMMNVKGTTEKQVNALKDYAAQLQKTGVVEDDTTKVGMSQLATFGLQADTIKKLTPGLQDLAVSQYGVNVSGEQMQSMANLVGKAMTGSAGALTKYGVTLTDAQKKMIEHGTEQQRMATITDALKSNFGGLNESMAKTTAGGLQQLKNSFGDFKEMLGGKLLPLINKGASWVNAHMPQIMLITESVFKGIGDAVNWVMDIYNTSLKPSLTELFAWINKNMPTIKAVFSTTFKIIGEVLKVAITIVVDFIKITVKIVTTVIEVAGTVKKKFIEIKDAIVNPIKTAVSFVKESVGKIKEFFGGLHIELPKFKMPHFTITGKWDLIPPGISTPHIGVDWYAEGGILTQPTIFGQYGGSYLGGGEKGMEAVLPVEKLSSILARTLKEMNIGNPVVNNFNQPFVKNDITNNNARQFDMDNGLDNLSRAIKAELFKSGTGLTMG